jgi:hypothetical protein
MLQRKTHPFVARPFGTSSGWTVRRREEETLHTHQAPIAVLIVLAVFAGCTSSTSAPPPSPSVSTASTSPTPTLSAGQQAANEVVIKYRALIDELRSQDMPDSARLASVARDSAYEKWTQVLQDDFVNGYHQIGAGVVAIKSIYPGATPRQWLVSGCLDVTKLDVVDKSGKTTLQRPGGINHVIYIVDQDSTTLKWYVTDETYDGASC